MAVIIEEERVLDWTGHSNIINRLGGTKILLRSCGINWVRRQARVVVKIVILSLKSTFLALLSICVVVRISLVALNVTRCCRRLSSEGCVEGVRISGIWSLNRDCCISWSCHIRQIGWSCSVSYISWIGRISWGSSICDISWGSWGSCVCDIRWSWSHIFTLFSIGIKNSINRTGGAIRSSHVIKLTWRTVIAFSIDHKGSSDGAVCNICIVQRSLDVFVRDASQTFCPCDPVRCNQIWLVDSWT